MAPSLLAVCENSDISFPLAGEELLGSAWEVVPMGSGS